MFTWWSNLSLRYKFGISIGFLFLVLGASIFAYVRAVQQQTGNARELNLGLRASTWEMLVLANDVVNAETNLENELSSIEAEFQKNLLLSESFAGLFAASDGVSPTEFTDFWLKQSTSYPDVVFIAYAEPVSDRAAFESETLAGFPIYQLDETGNSITAEERPLYFPYIFVEPSTTQGALRGFDLGSSPERFAALEQARDTGRSIATEPIILVGEQEVGILIVTPIYPDGQIPTTLEERRAKIQGYIILRLDIAPVIRTAFSRLGLRDSLVQIWDITDGRPGKNLYSVATSFSVDAFTVTPVLEIFNRQWELTLVQDFDTNARLSQIQRIASDLENRLDGLGNGSQELGLEGIDRHNSPQITNTYQELRITYGTLQSNLTNFLGANNLNERAIQLRLLRQNTFQTVGLVDTLVGLLTLEIEAEEDLNTQQASILSAIGIILALLAVIILAFTVNNLNQLNQATAEMLAGNLSTRTHITANDEIGQIGNNINQLAERLSTTVETLEKQVAEQTRDLETVLDLSGRISTILQVDRLLQDVTDLIKERFNLYHAHIYLIDPQTNLLVLAAGAGYVGRQMVSERRSISLANLKSIVADVARNRQSVIVNDVHASPTFLPHPLLPDTSSEFATALVSRGQVLGVLDVQSDELNYFNEDIQQLLETTASQVASAISNARLFEEADRARRQQEALGQISQQMQSAADIDEFLQVVARELGKALRVPNTAVELGFFSSRPAIMTKKD